MVFVFVRVWPDPLELRGDIVRTLRQCFVVFVLLPVVLSIVLPLCVYVQPMVVSHHSATISFAMADEIKALFQGALWCGIVFALVWWPAGDDRNEFPKREWSVDALWFVCVGVSILGGLAQSVHVFFVLPAGWEELVHQMAEASRAAMALNLLVLFQYHDQLRWRRRLLARGLLFGNVICSVGLPLSVAHVGPAAYAILTVVFSMVLMKFHWRQVVVVTMLGGLLITSTLMVKSYVRTAAYGGTITRVTLIPYLQGEEPFSLRANENEDVLFRGASLARTFEEERRQFRNYDPNYDRLRFSFKSTLGKDVAARVMHRLNQFSLLVYVIKVTPTDIPYMSGESYLPLIYSGIPRAICPDKPRESIGQMVGHRYGLLAESDFSSSVNTGILSEAWMNGGWPVVVLTAVVVGIVLRGACRIVNISPSRPGRLILAVVLISPALGIFENGLHLTVGGMLHSVMVFGGVILLLEVSLRRCGATTALPSAHCRTETSAG